MQPQTLHPRRGKKIGVRSSLLIGSLSLALLPLLADAQVNRSRPPTPPPNSGSSGSSGSSGQKRDNPPPQQNNNPPRQSNNPPPQQNNPPPKQNNNPPPNAGSSGSSGSSGGSGSQSSSGNRTPREGRRDSNPVTGGGGGGNSASNSSGSNSGGGIRNNPVTQRDNGPFSNPVHSYTGPLSPFDQYRPPNGQRGTRTPDNRFGPYTGPLSPFMTYQPPKNDRRSYPSGFDRFNNSRESFSYRYRNGLYGRSNACYYSSWGEYFFPGGIAYFPYYYPQRVYGVTYPSPYAFYVDLFPSYISLSVGYYSPPQYVFVPVPLYTNTGLYRGWRQDDVDDYYLNREADRLREREQELDARERELNERERKAREDREVRKDRDLTIAADDIARAWQDKDIQLLAKHTRRDVRIAVYLRGKYQYSLDTTDYLDMTRDAFRSGKTLTFKLDKTERKQKDIYLLTGRHTFRNKDGEDRTIFLSYVVEKMDNDYIITQVGTAPEVLEE